jgi:CMP-N-acetylneuraminic acid synthetase
MDRAQKPANFAMIPARMGSERLPRKNLVMLAGKPLIAHAVEIARAAGVFDRIVINADHEIFGEIAAEYGAEFYQRPAEFATSQAKSDDVVNDFLLKHPCGFVTWVNPISPLQTPAEVAAVVRHFMDKRLDSLVTVCKEQVHINFRGQPLNYAYAEPFAKTQDLDPVQRFVYSVMMWRREPFLSHYRQHGYALLCGQVGFYPVNRLSAIIVKYAEDIRLCEAILSGRQSAVDAGLDYFARRP